MEIVQRPRHRRWGKVPQPLTSTGGPCRGSVRKLPDRPDKQICRCKRRKDISDLEIYVLVFLNALSVFSSPPFGDYPCPGT